MNAMGKRQKEWARKARLVLISELGGKCVRCGSREHLEFDCILPCGDEHHRMDTERRICFYRRMHTEGNLQLLCNHKAGSCHEKKTSKDRRDLASGQVQFFQSSNPY